jgi:hypothetical protein
VPTTTYVPARLGRCPIEQAKQNRLRFELWANAASCTELVLPAGDRAARPEGDVWFDTAAVIRPRPGRTPLRIIGAGTWLANKYLTGPFPDNCTLVVADQRSWADPFTRPSAAANVLALADATNYAAGTPAYSFHFDGYYGPGMTCRRHTVTFRTAAVVQLDSDPDAQADHLKAVPGFAAQDAAAGATRLRLLPGKGPPPSVGQLVQVTGGPAVANEQSGEWRTAVALEGDTLVIDRPLERTWPQPVVATTAAVEGVTFEGVTFGQPSHPQACPLFAKFTHGLRLLGCRVGAVGEQARPASVNTSGDVRLTDCGGAGVALNTVAGFAVRGGTWGTLTLEEACFDGDLADLRLVAGPPGTPGMPWVNGLQALLGCSHLRVRGLTCQGHDGTGAALIGDMPRSTLRDVTVELTRGGPDSSGLWVSGDEILWDNLVSEHRLMVAGGGVRVIGGRVPRVDIRAGSTGECVGVSSGAGQTYPQGRWQWLGGSPAAAAPDAVTAAAPAGAGLLALVRRTRAELLPMRHAAV